MGLGELTTWDSTFHGSLRLLNFQEFCEWVAITLVNLKTGQGGHIYIAGISKSSLPSPPRPSG